MIDPDTLYFSSEKYRNLVDVIGDEITDEDLAQRKGSPIEACRHGSKVWDHIQESMKMLRAKSVFELDQSQATIYDLLYWASAFADELHDASLKDKFFVSKQLDFCENFVETHGDMLNKDVSAELKGQVPQTSATEDVKMFCAFQRHRWRNYIRSI